MLIRSTLFTSLCLLGLSLMAQSHTERDGHHQVAPTAKLGSIEDPILLTELKYDFGMIPQGKPVYHNFVIKNVSKSPIKLDNVAAACGCTTPEWSREEIAAGASTTIRVGYNAAAEGIFDKPVTLYYGDKVKQFSVAGTVWRTPEGPAPRNNSIDLLKKQTL